MPGRVISPNMDKRSSPFIYTKSDYKKIVVSNNIYLLLCVMFIFYERIERLQKLCVRLVDKA